MRERFRRTVLPTRLRQLAFLAGVLLAFPIPAPADGLSVEVELNASNSAARAVEDATRDRVLRDYRFAWSSLAQAVEGNTPAALDGPFRGAAKQWLSETIARQSQAGLSTRYRDQNHKLDVTFYAPEGDLMVLHDTARYRMQVLDHGRPIHDERVLQHYVVLMTPARDRWVIRQMQSVSQF